MRPNRKQDALKEHVKDVLIIVAILPFIPIYIGVSAVSMVIKSGKKRFAIARYKHGKAVEERGFQKQRSDGYPRQLPALRKRSLTLPLYFEYGTASTEKALGIKKNSGSHRPSESFLLTKIPPDIRLTIWELVLTAPNIILFRENERLYHVVQEDQEIMGYGYGPMPKFPHSRSQTQLAALIKTCRQTYSEAITFLYSTNSFALYQNDTIFDLQRSILPRRFSSIRFLTLHWQFRYEWTFDPGAKARMAKAPWDIETWKRACDILSNSMPGLQEILIVVKGPFRRVEGIASMLQYLNDVKVESDEFWVRVPRSWNAVTERDEGSNLRRMLDEQDSPFNVFREYRSYPERFPGPDLPGRKPDSHQIRPVVRRRGGLR